MDRSAAAPVVVAPASLRSVHAGLVGMAVLWGASWSAGRVLALAMPPLTSAAWRFLLAAAVLATWALLSRGWPRLSRKQWAGLVLGAVVGVYAWAVLMMFALRHVEASRAALVVTTNPVFTTMLAAWIFKERFNARIAIGLVLAVAGGVVVLTHGQPMKLFAGDIGVGEWLLLGCIASWVGYTLIGKALMRGIDSLTATAITSVIGMVLLWVTALVVDGPASMAHTAQTLSGHVWTVLIFMSLGATVLAYAWYNRGIAVLGAGTAASYINLVPIFGVGLAALTLGEKLDASLAAGGTLVVAGLVVSNSGRKG